MELRAATAGDYPAFAALFPELGVPDPLPSASAWADDLAPRTVLATVDGEVVGYCYFQVLADSGYVRHLVVSPRARRAGVGRALLLEVVRRLSAAGCGRWCLNVKPDNEPALRLYQSLGMTPQRTSTQLELQWADVERLAAPPVDVSLDPDRDGRAEDRFGLPRGQAREARALRRTVITLAAADQIVGFCAFDPRFPGAFPFRVATPDHAGALLRAMRPHALPEHSYVRVVVDDGPVVRAALVDVGARALFEILHLAGPLPAPLR